MRLLNINKLLIFEQSYIALSIPLQNWGVKMGLWFHWALLVADLRLTDSDVNKNGFFSTEVNLQCVKEGVMCKTRNDLRSLMLIASFDQNTRQLLQSCICYIKKLMPHVSQKDKKHNAVFYFWSFFLCKELSNDTAGMTFLASEAHSPVGLNMAVLAMHRSRILFFLLLSFRTKKPTIQLKLHKTLRETK